MIKGVLDSFTAVDGNSSGIVKHLSLYVHVQLGYVPQRAKQTI